MGRLSTLDEQSMRSLSGAECEDGDSEENGTDSKDGST